MSRRTTTTRIAVRPIVPKVPNFLGIEGMQRADGERVMFPLSDFDDDALREIGREWTEALLARATAQRAEGGDG